MQKLSMSAAALLVTLSLMIGCGSTSEIRYVEVADCSRVKPIYITSGDLLCMSRKLKEQIDRNNSVYEMCKSNQASR